MAENIARSADVLSEIMANSPALRELAAKDPTVLKVISDGLVKYLPTPALVSNTRIYIIVVASLGIVAVSAVIGGVVLAFGVEKPDIPATVTALGSAAIGALAGLLAPGPSTSR